MANIFPQAESFLLTGDQGIACLFIHGFSASPSEVYPVARLIFQQTGYTVSGPLLPGHGCTPQEMNQTCWEDWFGRVEDEIDYLERNHSRVFVAGLSMGGLLGLYAAGRRPDLRGVVAINTPILTTSPGRMRMLPLLKYIRPYHPKKIDHTAEEMQRQGRFAYPVMPLKALHSMNQLRDIVMAQLPDLDLPILLIQSRRDEAVDPRSIEYLTERIQQAPVKIVQLENSGHIATMGHEKDLIAGEIVNFIDTTLG